MITKQRVKIESIVRYKTEGSFIFEAAIDEKLIQNDDAVQALAEKSAWCELDDVSDVEVVEVELIGEPFIDFEASQKEMEQAGQQRLPGMLKVASVGF